MEGSDRAAQTPGSLSWLVVSAVVVAADHVTKAWALAALSEYSPTAVIPGWNWYLSYNTGAAFSFLSAAGGWQRQVLILFALAISAFLAYCLASLRRSARWLALAYSLIIGGALSNAIDRLWRGHVVDFIQWFWRDWYWPTFNLADVAIVSGAVLLVMQSTTRSER